MEVRQVKIVVLGESGVGKSAFLERFANQKYSSHYRATIGCDFFSKHITVGQTPVSVQLWDTAGQERYHALSTSFYRGADCCILVYDITDNNTFKKLAEWKQTFLEEAKPTNPEAFPFILVGNKADLELSRAVSSRELRQWSGSHSAQSFEASAKDGTNVDRVFHEAVALSLQREPQSVSRPGSSKLEPFKPRRFGCCNRGS